MNVFEILRGRLTPFFVSAAAQVCPERPAGGKGGAEKPAAGASQRYESAPNLMLFMCNLRSSVSADFTEHTSCL